MDLVWFYGRWRRSIGFSLFQRGVRSAELRLPLRQVTEVCAGRGAEVGVLTELLMYFSAVLKVTERPRRARMIPVLIIRSDGAQLAVRLVRLLPGFADRAALLLLGGRGCSRACQPRRLILHVLLMKGEPAGRGAGTAKPLKEAEFGFKMKIYLFVNEVCEEANGRDGEEGVWPAQSVGSLRFYSVILSWILKTHIERP